MQASELNKIFVDELRDIYSAETQLVKALPKMAKSAASDELRAGFEKHLEQTKGHRGWNKFSTGSRRTLPARSAQVWKD